MPRTTSRRGSTGHGAALKRTTVSLPTRLLEAVGRAVREGPARSRSEFLESALRREFTARERAAIDADFAAMADDPEYQEEARGIEREFASASWEALQAGEDRS